MNEREIAGLPKTPSPQRKSKLRSIIMRLIGIAGLGLFAYIIYKTGLAKVWQAIRNLTVLEIMALIGLRFLYWGIRTLNWQVLVRASNERVPFLELFGARIAGNAVGYLTPTGNLGAETMRIFMLDRIDRKKVVATVIVDKTIEFLAGIFATALSVLFVIITFALPQRHKITLVALTACVFALLVFLMAKQRQGLFTWALDALGKLKIKIPAVEKRRDQIRETDAHISAFYRERRGLFYLLFGSYFAQSWVWALEIFITFLFVGGSHVSLFKCFLIVTLGSFYTFVPVPGAMGVYELVNVSLFALLHIAMPAGMAVILIRRVLAIVWSGVGLIPLLRKRAYQDRAAEA